MIFSNEMNRLMMMLNIIIYK